MWSLLFVFVVLISFFNLTGKGFIPDNTFAQSPNESAVLDANTKTADLRVMLNSLHKQHVDLAAAAMRDGYDQFGSDNFKASTQALDNNSVAIADMVGSFYGSDARNNFLEAWRNHIDSYMNYTLAVKNGNQEDMDRSRSDLDSQADQLAGILNSVNPNVQRDIVRQIVNDHGQMMLFIIDAYASGDRDESYARQNDAYDQIGEIADGLTLVIVNQFPERFQ